MPPDRFGGVLIGALGLSSHAKPRYSNEIDLFMPDSFGRPKISCFEQVGQRIASITTISAGVKIASRAGLITILLGERRAQASAEVMALLRFCHVDLIR